MSTMSGIRLSSAQSHLQLDISVIYGEMLQKCNFPQTNQVRQRSGWEPIASVMTVTKKLQKYKWLMALFERHFQSKITKYHAPFTSYNEPLSLSSSADYYALLSPHIGSDSSYNGYDPSYHDTSLYNQIRWMWIVCHQANSDPDLNFRYQSLDRPVKRRRKVPESILKNGYNSLPRGTSAHAPSGPGSDNLRNDLT